MREFAKNFLEGVSCVFFVLLAVGVGVANCAGLIGW
jgi:hypothetical protein